MSWRLVYTSQARRDAKKERLLSDMTGACPRRINIQHRLVYQVLDQIRTGKVLRMRTRYE